MFRHIQRFINSAKALGWRKLAIPEVPAIVDYSKQKFLASKPARRPARSWKAVQLRKKRAQLQCVMEIGNGYDRVPVAAPSGYFWKQDSGGSKWRLYSEPAQGM